MLKNKACQKVETAKPGFKIQAAISIINALITSRNKPSETMVAGMVKKIRTGFTETFSIESKAASAMAYQKLSRYTPGSI